LKYIIKDTNIPQTSQSLLQNKPFQSDTRLNRGTDHLVRGLFRSSAYSTTSVLLNVIYSYNIIKHI